MPSAFRLPIFCTLALLIPLPAAFAADDPPPVAAFAGLVQVGQIALSPDGQSLGYIFNAEGKS